MPLVFCSAIAALKHRYFVLRIKRRDFENEEISNNFDGTDHSNYGSVELCHSYP
jgi:hypothetical protein